ncbi:hypothetical protein B0H12DRAFT_1082366 [Mycena haematopus]|nr:hypothetical protein B0H12DRAFT_1082366 [Mycena haematopus]
MPPRQKKTTEAETDGNIFLNVQLCSDYPQAPAQTPKRSRRARRAPTAPDKTPPPPATPPPHRRPRRQPAPPTQPAPAPAPAQDPLGQPDNVGDDGPFSRPRQNAEDGFSI